MCLNYLFNSLLILSLAIFALFWLSRQYEQARGNFDKLEKVIDNTQKKSYCLNLFVTISGNYHGRKVGWFFRAYQDNQRCTWLYVEPNCKLKSSLIVIDHPHPTRNTSLIGKRIYYVREFQQGTQFGGLIRDPMPSFTEQEIINMLNELITAAEIMETNAMKDKTI